MTSLSKNTTFHVDPWHFMYLHVMSEAQWDRKALGIAISSCHHGWFSTCCDDCHPTRFQHGSQAFDEFQLVQIRFRSSGSYGSPAHERRKSSKLSTISKEKGALWQQLQQGILNSPQKSGWGEIQTQPCPGRRISQSTLCQRFGSGYARLRSQNKRGDVNHGRLREAESKAKLSWTCEEHMYEHYSELFWVAVPTWYAVFAQPASFTRQETLDLSSHFGSSSAAAPLTIERVRSRFLLSTNTPQIPVFFSTCFSNGTTPASTKASWMISPSMSLPIAPIKAPRKPHQDATLSVFIHAPPATLALGFFMASSTSATFCESCKPVASVPGDNPNSSKWDPRSSITEITSTVGLPKPTRSGGSGPKRPVQALASGWSRDSKDSRRRSARAKTSSAAGSPIIHISGTATVKQPAAFADWTPDGASSNTTHRLASTPRISAQALYTWSQYGPALYAFKKLEVTNSYSMLQYHVQQVFSSPREWFHTAFIYSWSLWVCLKIGNTPKPNGFADHYPY